MTGFKVLSSIQEMELKNLPISSQTLSVGDLIELTAGATTWAACTSSSDHFTRKAICFQTVTSSATTVLAYEVNGKEKVEAEVTNTASAAHNGDRMVLTDKNTVNNTGSDATGQTAAFVQDGLGSTTTSIVGRILVGNGVDPDAT